MKEETKANVKEETKSKWDKVERIASCVFGIGVFLFDILTGPSSNYRDKPTVDPDEELKREGYDKVGKDVWYDRDGKRREKDIWRKKKY